MSLIDDALKKAREDAVRRESARPPGASRWAPSHVPGRRRATWRSALPLAAVFVAGCAVAWIFVGRAPARTQPAPSPVAAAPLPSARAIPSEPPAKAQQKPAVPVPAPRARKGPASTSAKTVLAVPETSPAAAPARPPAPSSPGRNTFVRTATLPGGETIELGGIVFSEGTPVALINGKIVAPGGAVGDYTVVQIRPEKVDFSGNGLSFSILLR
ncbi:MAG: hypothetical protein ACRD16_11465 [Thermoanaerobaculia bacterium]